MPHPLALAGRAESEFYDAKSESTASVINSWGKGLTKAPPPFGRASSGFATSEYNTMQHAIEKAKKAMMQMESSRQRRKRRKSICKRRQVAEEIYNFRGKVKAICSGMYLDISSLQDHIEEKIEQGRQELHQVTIDVEPELQENQYSLYGFTSEAERLLTYNDDKDDPKDEVPSLRLPYSWTFSLYNDDEVLHAHLVPDNQEEQNLWAAQETMSDPGSRGGFSLPGSISSHTARSAPHSALGSPFGSPGSRSSLPSAIADEIAQRHAPKASPALPPATGQTQLDAIHEKEQKTASTGLEVPSSEELPNGVIPAINTKDIFFFEHGCIVFWGLDEEEQSAVLDVVKPFQEFPVEEEEEDMTFYYGIVPRVHDQQICLSSQESIEKLSVSFALAQSCALSVLEARVEESFETTRKHPQELAETGYVTLTKSAVSKLMGYICIVRSHVSVQAKLIDLPGFFTEHAEWEKVYSRAGVNNS